MKKSVIFEQNVNALSESDPDLARRVKETNSNSQYKLIRSKTGYPNVLVEREAGWVTFYDNDDPVEYARGYLEALNLKHAPIVVFMGFGLGHHLNEFFKLLSDELGTKEIIIFENDMELFRLALEISDIRSILNHRSIHFFVGGDPDESFVKLRTDILMRNVYWLRSMKTLPLPASIALDQEYYLKAFETVKKAACHVMIMVGNDSLDSLAGLENMFLNMEQIVSNPGIKTLLGKFRGKPGVLVATGPSLNKNMHLLNGLRDKALIISCDAGLIPLKKKGIRRHCYLLFQCHRGS